MRVAALFSLGMLALGGCRTEAGDLPPVKTPLGVHIACHAPQLLPPLNLCETYRECPLPPLRCDETHTILVHVASDGRPQEAFIAEHRSPGLDACVFKGLSALTFEPARECDGAPLSGEYVAECGIPCDSPSTSHRAE